MAHLIGTKVAMETVIVSNFRIFKVCKLISLNQCSGKVGILAL